MDNPLLKNCGACGHEISRYAPFCRNCGHPQGRPLIIGLLVLFLLILLALYVGFMAFCASNPESLELRGGTSLSPRRLTQSSDIGTGWSELSSGRDDRSVPLSYAG